MNSPMLGKHEAFIDAHCHIDLYKNPEAIVAVAETMRIFTIAVTNAPSVFHYTAKLVADCRYVRAAAGLHPQLVLSHGNELGRLQPLLGETRYVGEVGLDYSTKSQSERRTQRNVLNQVLDWCAGHGNKVLTLHSRRAARDVISAIGDKYPGRVILHWFSGPVRELERAVEYGMYFSVNSSMVRSVKGHGLISKMPVERVITESDGPFVKFSSFPADPSHMKQVIRTLADIWGVPSNQAQARVLSNFRTLLS